MSTVPSPKGERRRRHRNPPKGWKAIPTAVKILAPLCVALLILIPVAKRQGWFARRQQAAAIESSPSYIRGLEVVEDSIDRDAHLERGTVRNSSDKTIDDVQVSYSVRDKSAELVGVIVAKVGSVGPHQSVKFQTNPGPATGTQYYIREVTGNPR